MLPHILKYPKVMYYEKRKPCFDIDFQKLNFRRSEGGDYTHSISPTDNALKLNFWK